MDAGGSNWSGQGPYPAGNYVFIMTQAVDEPLGDADLYLGLGRAPTLQDYDDLSLTAGSDESLSLHLDEPVQVVLMAHGWEGIPESSAYLLESRVAVD